MLVIEYLSNGTRRVRLHKDWNPSRISRAYTPPLKNHVQSVDACRIQAMLLKNPVNKG